MRSTTTASSVSAQRVRRRIRYTETTFGRGRVVDFAGFSFTAILRRYTVSRAVTGVAEVAMRECPFKPCSYWNAHSYEVAALV
jgi:hypothetical protein